MASAAFAGGSSQWQQGRGAAAAASVPHRRVAAAAGDRAALLCSRYQITHLKLAIFISLVQNGTESLK